MTALFSELTAFVCFMVYASFFEWALHKYLMHQPRWRYPFHAHAVVHHGLFRTGTAYFLSERGHLRKVRFAWWNAPVILLLHLPPILYLQHLFAAGLTLGALSALALYYFLYEYLHYCMHVPKGRPLETTRWFRWLDAHHHMHHKRHTNNLNVVLPIADAVFRTLVSPRARIPAPDRGRAAARIEAVLS